ncbi:MAG: glycosyltransferase [Bacteroidaceae bacterium]|nr:glycosyltransferase [Bacteroidaceae bacterium]
MKRVSIIIVTYNSEDDIYDCVDSIIRCADIPKMEIELVVVDNNSCHPEPMFQRLRDLWGEDIVLIENTRNGGYGQGNNVGIRSCSAPLLLIMNPDVRLLTPFFQEAVNAFERDEGLVMLGAKQMLSADVASTNSFAPTYMMNGYFRSILGAICTRLEWYVPSLMYFSGSCFYVRKSMLEAVALFDESVFMYGEEDDIRWRLQKRFGQRFVYNRRLKYVHLVSERKPDLEYEKKIADMTVCLHAKKGRSPQVTWRNLLRGTNVLIFRARVWKLFGRQCDERLAMLMQLRAYLKKKLLGE